METRYIFHLSIPVADLESAERFYVEVLGASVGRKNDEWLDILLWGHQITLHRRPGDVAPVEEQGQRHFGVVLPWAEWETEAARIEGLGVTFLGRPQIKLGGTDDEQAKLTLSDPSGNVIEMKTYRNPGRTLRLPE